MSAEARITLSCRTSTLVAKARWEKAHALESEDWAFAASV